MAILCLKKVQVHLDQLITLHLVHVSILASRLFDTCLSVAVRIHTTRQFFIIFISVVATQGHLSSYRSQTSDRCAHIYTVFFFKYTYTGKGALGKGGGGA